MFDNNNRYITTNIEKTVPVWLRNMLWYSYEKPQGLAVKVLAGMINPSDF